MDRFFKDRVVLVVGASSGIGKAATEAFARRGSEVILAARSKERLETIVGGLRSEGFKAHSFAADISIRDVAEHLIDDVIERFGRIDILVNSVGIHDLRRVFDSDPDDIEHVMRVNFMGPVYCTLRALRFMLRQGNGIIVNVCSVEGRRALRHPPGYVASKFALSGFTELLRLELKGIGVRVIGIYPGYVETPLIEGLKLRGKGATRPIKPEDVADAIIRAIERGKVDVIIPNPLGIRLFLAMNMIFPGFVDGIVDRMGLSGEIPKGMQHEG